MTNHHTQLICLLLQLPHPLRLDGQVATDFRDVAFNSIRQLGESEPPGFSPHGNLDSGLRHRIPLEPTSCQFGMPTYVLFGTPTRSTSACSGGGCTCALLDSAANLLRVPLAMILRNVKLIVVAAYILTVVAVAVASGMTSGAGLIVFTAVALLPSGALLMLWKDPSQTLSETIQSARR